MPTILYSVSTENAQRTQVARGPFGHKYQRANTFLTFRNHLREAFRDPFRKTFLKSFCNAFRIAFRKAFRKAFCKASFNILPRSVHDTVAPCPPLERLCEKFSEWVCGRLCEWFQLHQLRSAHTYISICIHIYLYIKYTQSIQQNSNNISKLFIHQLYSANVHIYVYIYIYVYICGCISVLLMYIFIYLFRCLSMIYPECCGHICATKHRFGFIYFYRFFLYD